MFFTSLYKKTDMTYLLADSGATKTEWILIENGKRITSSTTIGFNPYYYSNEQLKNSIVESVIPLITSSKIESLFLYGSGISTDKKKNETKMLLKSFFPSIHIEVDHDLLFAARGLLKNEAGIACILGTGSNSCVYDGNNITHNIPSLGYLFADEGSGTHIGKLFIEDYLRDQLPSEIKLLAEEKFNLSIEFILDIIYNQKHPNKFLSSFSLFVGEHMKYNYLNELVKKSFRAFFETYILKYPDFEKLPLKFMGSVALYHENILKEVAAEYGLSINSIEKSPIPGLIEYHSK